jgi:hypothetical protein
MLAKTKKKDPTKEKVINNKGKAKKNYFKMIFRRFES